jgi:hypothetical protein
VRLLQSVGDGRSTHFTVSSIWFKVPFPFPLKPVI